MGKTLKILAIVALLVTVAGAGAVLYGMNTLVPEVEQVQVTVTPALQAQSAFDTVLAQLEEGTFAGRVLGETDGLSAQDCTFVTYTLRLQNRGFFPAEWISLSVQKRQGEDGAAGGDVLQLDNYGANVLAAGQRGDISATILTTLDAQNTGALIEGSCHVLGQMLHFQAFAEE